VKSLQTEVKRLNEHLEKVHKCDFICLNITTIEPIDAPYPFGNVLPKVSSEHTMHQWRIDSTHPPTPIEGHQLIGEFDASKWAAEFVRMHGGDEGLMLSWFANAIMAGYDRGRGEFGQTPDEIWPSAPTVRKIGSFIPIADVVEQHTGWWWRKPWGWLLKLFTPVTDREALLRKATKLP